MITPSASFIRYTPGWVVRVRSFASRVLIASVDINARTAADDRNLREGMIHHPRNSGHPRTEGVSPRIWLMWIAPSALWIKQMRRITKVWIDRVMGEIRWM